MTRFGAPKRHRGPARQSEPASARLLRRQRVRHAHHRRPRGAGSAIHQPCRRLASLHACPPRHPRRRARLPVAAVGIDRSVGGRGHLSDPARPASPRCWSPIIRTSSKPAARTTTATSPRGIRARSRGRSVAHAAGSVVDRYPGARRTARAVASWLRHLAHALPRRTRLSGPRTMQATVDWLRREVTSPQRDPEQDRFFLLVDEFDPHEPFDTPAPWANRYDDPSEPGRSRR